MRHGKRTKKLGKTKSHREAMLKNLLTSLIIYGTIKTTDTKAKALKSYAEKVIEIAKDPVLSNKRRLIKILKTRDAFNKLINEIAPRFKDKKGGYVTITKADFRSAAFNS
jgi:large subunit ribosomal protein L17